MKHKKTSAVLVAVLSCAAMTFASSPARAQNAPPGSLNAGKQGTNNWDYTAANGGVDGKILKQVGVDQKLDKSVPLDLSFRDENGKSVKLGEYLGAKPVMITMLQMTCDEVCSAQLSAMTNAMNKISFSAGKEYDVLNVSIDPREGPLIAHDVQEERLKEYKRPTAKAGWHFLTGDAKNIKALASALGIRYVWHEPTKQYIHPDGIVLVTPDAKISRYFLSLDYNAQDIKFSLMEASKDRIGTFVDHIAQSCFHYNPSTGKYSFQIMAFLRVTGLAFVLGTLVAIAAMVTLEKRRKAASKGGSSPQLKQA